MNTTTTPAQALPAAPDIEALILAGLLMQADTWHEVSDMLRPEMFSDARHRTIFRVLGGMHRRGQPVDLATVFEAARSSGDLNACGGVVYLSDLTNRLASTKNIRAHALIVVQKHMAREQHRVGADMMRRAMDETCDVFDTCAEVLAEVGRLGELAQPAERTAAEVAQEVVNPGPDQAVRTGFADLDRRIRLERGAVTIVGARPAMGKSAFAISLAWRHALSGGVPLFVSLEMRDHGLVNRLVCGEVGVSVWRSKRRELNDQETERMARWAMENDEALGRMVIDESAAMDTTTLHARVDRLKRTRGVSMVLVDYLHLLTMRGERFKSRYDRITAVSEQLRVMAKQTGLPFVVLSQLSRGEKAGGGTPRLPSMSDLRESGQIEQDAETILLLHRPAYYDPAADNTLQVVVAKSRDGKDGIAELAFDAEGVRVVDKDMFSTRRAGVPAMVDDEPF